MILNKSFCNLSGILERPNVPSSIEEVSYKLFVAGKSGVGKTCSVARFAGQPFPTSYHETPGIRKTNVYWPVKIWEKVIVFKLQFWEAGDNSIKKYSHILSVSNYLSKFFKIFFLIPISCSFVFCFEGMQR